MVESTTAPKKHLALDTDWTSAVTMVLLFIFCALFTALSAYSIFYRHHSAERITWRTWVMVGMAAWLFVSVRTSEHKSQIRAVIALMSVGPVSRIVLRIVHATVETQLANDAIVRVIDGLLFAGLGLSVLWWFKSKSRHVDGNAGD
jgi:hypothetical protein